jgi:hypothetical protein
MTTLSKIGLRRREGGCHSSTGIVSFEQIGGLNDVRSR